MCKDLSGLTEATHFWPVCNMDEKYAHQGSSTHQGILAPPVGSLNLLCEVRPSANDQVACSTYQQMWSGGCCALPDQPSHSISVVLQTLGLPMDLFRAVLAEAVQQHGTASSLRLTSRSLAHACGAALVTGETARRALLFPPCRVYAVLLCSPLSFKGEVLCLQTAGILYLETPLDFQVHCLYGKELQRWLWQSGCPPARLPQLHL